MSYYYNNTNSEELQAVLDEKIEAFGKRQKIKQTKINPIMEKVLTKESIKNNYLECGTYVALSDDGTVIASNLCHHRLCNICNWRQAAKKWNQTKQIIEQVGEATYIHMVLTVRNCSAAELPQTLDHLMKSINRMTSTKKWKKRVLGYIRSMEITYNPEQTPEFRYHPHYHFIVVLPKNYMDNTDLFMSTYDWRKLWEQSARINYNSQFHWEIIKQTELNNAVAEVSKYAVKAAEIFKTMQSIEDVKALTNAIKGRRLYCMGGIIKQINATIENQTQTITEKIEALHNAHSYTYKDGKYTIYSG